MTASDFNEILDRRHRQSRTVLAKKANEYAFGDRLANIKAAALATGVCPRLALLGMMAKHWVSTVDLCHDRLPNNEAVVDEKLGDLQNWLILLEALLKEERGHVIL